MKRSAHFDFIERKLSELAYRIEVRGGLNLLNLHVHSENFYSDFVNLLFGWELKNLNAVNPNAAAIDLVDTKNKIVVQVSATATKQKVESALAKDLSAYVGYSFKFISISKNADDIRQKTYSNPYQLKFSAPDDILDVISLLRQVQCLDIEKMSLIYEFIANELKSEADPEKIESNITSLINILSKEDWAGNSGTESVPFEIEDKVTYNKLDRARPVIDDYKVHHCRIQKIYNEFDRQGVNKSISVLDRIRKEYLAICDNHTPDDCFFAVIRRVISVVKASANYNAGPDEELELCAGILVVDAFIRCKIFKNPINAHS